METVEVRVQTDHVTKLNTLTLMVSKKQNKTKNKMGLCGSLFRTSGYFLVAFIAFLAYFHFQCEKEKEIGAEKPIFDEFDPSKTDCEDVVLPFNPLGEKRRGDFGIEFLLNQFAPCALLKFIKFTQDIIYGSPPLLNEHNVSVTFHDARKKSPGKQRYGELILRKQMVKLLDLLKWKSLLDTFHMVLTLIH